MPIISEEDYLSHYGRKGMKWYQHIYGDKEGYKNLNRKQRKLVKRTAKQDIKSTKAYNDALDNEYDMRIAYENYQQTGSKKAYKKYNDCLNRSKKLAENLVKSMNILNEKYENLSKSLGAKGEERLKQMYNYKVKDIGNIGRRVWDDNYNADMEGVKKKKN